MAIRQVINSVIKPAIRKVIDAIMNAISAYRFDGFDDYAVLAYRAINPDGDIDIEFYTPPFSGVKTIIYQGAGEFDFTQCDFWLLRNGNNIEFRVGGAARGLGILPANEKFRVTLVGTALNLFNSSGSNILSASYTRGTYRSNNPVTAIGARLSGSLYVNLNQGIQRDLKINGVLYPIADRNQSVQLPSPTNLGAELITQTVLENPVVKGTQWTYLGNGRWQLISDGSGGQELRFLNNENQPEQGYLEFEIESISGVGSLTCTNNVIARSVFNTTGVKRFFYTSKFDVIPNGAVILFKRAVSGQPITCIIKNISFKPLATVSSTELVSNGDFGAGVTGWSSTGSATFSVNSGQASVGYVAGQNSRVTQLLVLEAGKYYEVTADVVSLTGVTSAILRVIRGSEGGFADVAEASISTSGKLRFLFMARASDASIGLRADQTNNGTIVWDNVSVRKVDLCNPLTLVNANDYWWSTIGAESRDVYVFDGVDDRAQLTYRAINPDGDIDIEWTQRGVPKNATFRAIVTQSFNSVSTAREFGLFVSDLGAIDFRVGGNAVISNVRDFRDDGTIRVLYVGSTFTVFFNGVQVDQKTMDRGGAREPTAPTWICGRNGGGTLNNPMAGIVYDIRINGRLWPMADRNQVIQLPEPSGLGAELITPTVLENPAIKGSQWTYLGAGRWQLIGDGSQNDLTFIGLANMPVNGCLVELEVESYSGAGTARFSSNSSVVNSTFTGTGIKRAYVTSQATFNIGRQTGALSMIIKNISFKPLAVVNSTELVVNGDFSAGTAGWAARGGATFNVVSGQANVGYVAGQTSRLETDLLLEANQYYQVSADVISISGVTGARFLLIRGAAGNYATINQVDVGAAGKISFVILAPATDAMISLRATGVSDGTTVWDNVSVRKLDSLCNPMNLINTTSDRWREIDK